MKYLLGIIMIAIINVIGDKIAKASKSEIFDEYIIGVITGVSMVLIYALTTLS
ncbi:hypothetical protein [Clostridium sp. CTA-6]